MCLSKPNNYYTVPTQRYIRVEHSEEFEPAVAEFTYPDVSAYSAYPADESESDWDREYNRDDVLTVIHILDTVTNESKHPITKTGD